MDIPRWRSRPIKRWEPGWKTMPTPSLDHAARFACAGKTILTTRSPRTSFRSRKCHENCHAGWDAEQSEWGKTQSIGKLLLLVHFVWPFSADTWLLFLTTVFSVRR